MTLQFQLSRRSSLLLLGLSTVTGAALWGSVYLDQGPTDSPLFYAVAFPLTTAWLTLALGCTMSRRTCMTRSVSFIAALVLPFLLSWSVVWFDRSGAIIFGLLLSWLLAIALCVTAFLTLFFSSLRIIWFAGNARNSDAERLLRQTRH